MVGNPSHRALAYPEAYWYLAVGFKQVVHSAHTAETGVAKRKHPEL